MIVESINISVEDDTNTKLQEAEASNLQACCEAARSVWSLLIRCICKLRLTEQTLNCTEGMVPAAVTVVQFLLDQLHQYCQEEAAEMSKPSPTSSKDINNKTRSQEDSKRTEMFRNACSSLSQLLTHILASTKLVHETFPAFFEGITCIFLDRLGVFMSCYLFRSANEISDVFAASHGSLDNVDVSDEGDTLAMRLEAPHLVRILRGLMSSQEYNVADSYCRCAVRQFPLTSFAANTLNRLQSTMLRGMFGKEDKAFGDAFQYIQSQTHISKSSSEMDNSIQPGQYNADLFLSKIWETLGWDVLLSRSPYCNSCSEENTNVIG